MTSLVSENTTGLYLGQLVRVKPNRFVDRELVGRRAAVLDVDGDEVFIGLDDGSSRVLALGTPVPVAALEPQPDHVPLVVHVRFDAWDYYIGRLHRYDGLPASELSNLFVIGAGYSRARAITEYGDLLSRQPGRLALLPLLRGKRIACWCKTEMLPDTPCHGDVLVGILRGATDGRIREVVKELLAGTLESWDIARHMGKVVAERV